MFVKHTYKEITVIHFVNLRNKLHVVVSSSEVVVRMDLIRKNVAKT